MAGKFFMRDPGRQSRPISLIGALTLCLRLSHCFSRLSPGRIGQFESPQDSAPAKRSPQSKM